MADPQAQDDRPENPELFISYASGDLDRAAVLHDRLVKDGFRVWFDKVRLTYQENVLTYDLRIPTWPFSLVAWLGDVSAVLLIAIRTWRLIVNPEVVVSAHGATE